MKPFFLLFLLGFYTKNLVAQTSQPLPVLPAFGEVSKEDLAMSSCAFEPDAPAMVLFHSRETEFLTRGEYGKFLSEVRFRLKIFTEKGFPHASISLPYSSKNRTYKIKNIRAAVHYLDGSGKIITRKLDKDDFFRTRIIEDANVLSFTFPDLRPGCIVEYRYDHVADNTKHLESWTFQHPVPCALSVFSIRLPLHYAVIHKFFGGNGPVAKTEPVWKGFTEEKKQTFSAANVPSFSPEPWMRSVTDNLQRASFILHEGFLNSLGDNAKIAEGQWYLTGSVFRAMTEALVENTGELPGEKDWIDSALVLKKVKEKTSFLFEKIKSKVPADCNQSPVPYDLAEAWKNKSGNSADVNILLLKMLRRAGVNCDPVFVSTRNHGEIDMRFPSFRQINGLDILVYDSSENYLLDASLPFQSVGIPPSNVLNSNVLILGKKKINWAYIETAQPLVREQVLAFTELTDKGVVEGGTTSAFYNYAKEIIFDSLHTSEAEKKLYNTELAVQIKSAEKEHYDSSAAPLVIRREFEYQPAQTDNFYFINPAAMTLQLKNPFTAETRKTAVHFAGPQQFTITFSLSHAAGIQLESLPKNTRLQSADSSMIYLRNASGGQGTISISQLLEIRKSAYSPEEYDMVKGFFEKVYALMNEEIVLKEIKK